MSEYAKEAEAPRSELAEPVPRPPGEIARVHGSLVESVTELDEAIERHVARIGPALGPPSDGVLASSTLEEAYGSSLAVALAEVEARVRRMTRFDREVTARVEL